LIALCKLTSFTAPAVLTYSRTIIPVCAIEAPAKWCWTVGALRNGRDNMQREYAIRQIAKREGFSLEKHGEDSYRLINERLNVIVFGLDGVPLETIASFLEKPESLANSPDAHHR